MVNNLGTGTMYVGLTHVYGNIGMSVSATVWLSDVLLIFFGHFLDFFVYRMEKKAVCSDRMQSEC